MDDQIAPGDQIGRPDFHILVMSKIWLPIWSPGAIWSPIRSPEHLVVDLVVVDAFSSNKLMYYARIWATPPPSYAACILNQWPLIKFAGKFTNFYEKIPKKGLRFGTVGVTVSEYS